MIRFKSYLKNYISVNNQKNYLLRITLFVLLILLCISFALPAFFSGGFLNLFTLNILEYNFSLVCNQSAEKCFEINNLKFLVCARCTGIYSGAMVSSLAALCGINIIFRNLLPLLVSSILLLVHVILIIFGVISYSKELSFATGFIFGAIIYIYISEILEQFISSNLKNRTNEK